MIYRLSTDFIRSHQIPWIVKDIEIKVLLKSTLTDQINDRALYMKAIDVSYYCEGHFRGQIFKLSKAA